MKKIFLIPIALLLINCVTAQIPFDSIAIKQLRFYHQRLSTSESQENRLLQLFKDFHTQITYVQVSTPDSTSRARLLKLQKDFEKSLKEILTAPQYKKWQALEKEQRDALKAHASTKKIRI